MTPLTKKDVLNYIARFVVTYGENLKTIEEQKLRMETYFDILKVYPKELCDRAVLNAMKNSEFIPKPATIVREIEKMQVAYEKSDTELWAELTDVLYEVSGCAYKFRFNFVESNGKTQGENARIRVEEIFNGLSPELKEYCRNSGGLVELANNDGLQYEKGRFMRIIPQIKERIKVRQSTDGQLAALITDFTGQLSLDKTKTKLLTGD